MPASPADSSHSSSPAKTTLPSPWAAVVRGGGGSDDQAPTPPPPSSSPSSSPAPGQTPPLTLEPPSRDDHRDAADGNVGSGRVNRPAWKALPNGVIEASGGKIVDCVTSDGGGGGVMGNDVAWPALSESTRASSKSSSSDSLASTNLSKALAEGSSSSSQGPVLPNSPHKLATNNRGSPRATENNTIPQRRKPSRRGYSGAVSNSSAVSNSGAASNSGGSWQPPSGFNHPQLAPPMPPPFPTFRVPLNGYVNIVPPIVDFVNTEPPFRGSGRDSRPAGVFAHPPMGDVHANSSRRGSFGPRDGNPQNNNYRNRHDQGRGNPPDRRDVRLQQRQRGASRGYRGPPPPPPLNAPVYVAPQSVRPPFGPPIGFSDITSPYYYPAFPVDLYRSPPYMASPTEIMIPMPGLPLPALLVKQIDYYFSDDNLVKDDYLKLNMDNQGWVPISIVAGFPRVRTLTDNIQLILESLGDSSVVEVQDDKIRRRGEWMKWVQFPAHGSFEPCSPSSRIANHNKRSLATSLQNVSLEGASNNDDSVEKISKMEDSHPHRKSSDQLPSI